jgi:hypothetical protein
MRLRYALCLALIVPLFVPVTSLADTGFVVSMNGANEVPPNGSTATGSGVFILNTAQTSLSWSITHNVANEIAAHVHIGAAGVPGPVAWGLGVGSPKVGSQPMPGIQVLNVTVNEAQEVPPNGSAATGNAMLTFNAGPTNLDYTLTHNVANQTAAHFHRQTPGVNGPVVQNIGVGSPISNTWVMPVHLVRSMFNDSIYVNVHSTAFPGGEIRGNVLFPTTDLKYLFSERLYVNIHSQAFPDGEIRGQITWDFPPTPVRSATWGRLKQLYR